MVRKNLRALEVDIDNATVVSPVSARLVAGLNGSIHAAPIFRKPEQTRPPLHIANQRHGPPITPGDQASDRVLYP